MIIDVQFNPGNNEWPRLLDAVLAAEEAGFGASWQVDHLAGRSMRGTTMLELFTTLGALAVATTTIELGTLVANVANREPGVLAVGAASVDLVAEGRLLLGLGAGTSPTSPFAAEQHAVAAAIEPLLADRHAKVERVLDLLEAMWSPERDETFETFPLPHRSPLPHPSSHRRDRPLVLLGVNSAALARLAGARTDGVNVWWGHPRRDDLLAVAVDAACVAGTPDDAFCVTVWAEWDDALLDPEHPHRRQMSELGVSRLVLAEFGPVDAEHVRGLRPLTGS